MPRTFPLRLAAAALVASLLPAAGVAAIDIRVDYTFDTGNFFNTPERRAPLEAAAARLSTVITSSLNAVSPAGTSTGTGPDWRVGFFNPSNGQPWQLSTAPNAASDNLLFAGVPAANGYGFAGLAQDEWILFAGADDLPGNTAGFGGTGTGTNFTTTFNDLQGPMHRGLISQTPGPTTDTVRDLPAWGGAISFDTGLNWNFDLDSSPSDPTSTDLYSIALHEILHALGVSTSWNQWQQHVSGNDFSGPESLAAYNADNNASLSSLQLAGGGNPHWADGIYGSQIFDAGDPNFVGTVGDGPLQDLLMEPVANFSPSVRRFELTNVDVAALRDVGWDTIDGVIPLLPGDANGDGTVDLADFGILRSEFGMTAGMLLADFNGDGMVDLADFGILRANFGSSAVAALDAWHASVVPEPTLGLAAVAAGGLLLRRRR